MRSSSSRRRVRWMCTKWIDQGLCQSSASLLWSPEKAASLSLGPLKTTENERMRPRSSPQPHQTMKRVTYSKVILKPTAKSLKVFLTYRQRSLNAHSSIKLSQIPKTSILLGNQRRVLARSWICLFPLNSTRSALVDMKDRRPWNHLNVGSEMRL